MTTSTQATIDADRQQTLLAEIRELRAAAMACAAKPAWPTPDSDVLLAVSTAFAAQQAVTAILLHLIQQADIRSLTKIKGGGGTASWLADELRITVPAARRLAKRARQVGSRPGVAEALTDGRINADQAGAIAGLVAGLPDGTAPAITAATEAAMIEEAQHLDAVRLTRSADRVLAVIDPGEASRREAQRAAREERARARARSTRRLKLSPQAHGGVRLTGLFDSEAAAVIGTALSRYDSAVSRPPQQQPDERTADQRTADALVRICELTIPPSDPTKPGRRTPGDPLTPAVSPTPRSGILISLDTPGTRSARRSTGGRRRTRAAGQSSAKDNGARQPLRR